MTPTCCRYCGRDTTSRSGICSTCLHGEPRGRRRKCRPSQPAPLEDDYGDESDANSVCDDGGVPEVKE